MTKKIILLLFVIFCCVASSYAQKPSADEAIIGSTFKALAKAFAGMADLDQLKLNNVVKVKKMDEEKFRKRYAKVYPILMDLPQDIRAKYKIEEGMTKEQAVRNILILDQQKINAIIDAVPDRVIAAQFKLYLNKKAQDLQKINLAVEINKLWSGFIEKAFKK
jgi:hypothetical protein